MEDTKPAKSKRKLRLILPLATILIITALVIFIKIMDAPAEGSISPQQNYQPAAEVPVQNKACKYDGKYISIICPDNYKQTTPQGGGSFLDTAVFYSADHSDKQAAVEIVQESLSNDSRVNLRSSHPETYKQLKDSAGNLVFSKNTGGSEYTGFVVHNNLVASISLSSSYTKDLSSDYNEFLKNLHWK